MAFRTIRLCGLLILPLCALLARADERSIVVIHGGEVRTPAYEAINRVLRASSADDGATAPQFFEEYLDNARFPGAVHEAEFAEYLRRRFQGRRVDVVLAWDPTALRFMLAHRAETFPGVPVVFGGVRQSTIDALALPRDFLGVGMNLDPAPTIQLALALRPETRELVLVTGTAELDRGWEAVARATPLPPQVGLRVLTGMTLEEIEHALATLGPHSTVLMGSFRRDGAGRTFAGSTAVMRRLRSVSAAPIFHFYETGIGEGAAGTYSAPSRAVAAEVAAIVRQLFAGAPPESVRLPTPAAPVPVVDWRELVHWNMDVSRLPPWAEVRFREPTFWDRYLVHVIALVLLVVVETLLVAALLVQRARRRGAEEALVESQRAMHQAANAAQLMIWTWDIAKDALWFSDAQAQEAMLPGPPPASLTALIERIHPEDRAAVKRAISRACLDEVDYESEYRVVAPDGATRWHVGRGRVERIAGAPRRMLGVTLDITRRKMAELDAQHQRSELAHLSRVTMLGELSSSVAHELNQPLMAILSNAQAARMFINRETIDLVELGSILDDIVENDKRAGDIIWGLRKMLRKEEAEHEPMGANDLVHEVLRLMRSDLMNRGVTVETVLAPGAPSMHGDHVQLQQVLLNLIMNACDAMAGNPREDRVLTVRTEVSAGKVRLSVADRGGGISPEAMKRIFKPFYTTKVHGLGLGLSVCSSIVASHNGELAAANNAQRGATFTIVLDESVPTEAVA